MRYTHCYRANLSNADHETDGNPQIRVHVAAMQWSSLAELERNGWKLVQLLQVDPVRHPDQLIAVMSHKSDLTPAEATLRELIDQTKPGGD